MDDKKVKITLILINIFVVIFVILLLIIFGVYFWEDIKLLNTIEGQIEFGNRIRSSGILGFFIIILVNIFQVVVAFIPGEFVEIICGMLYGPILGVVVCLIGFALGTMCIFGLVKLLGKPFIDMSISKNKKRLKFLEQETRALIILFFIFLIPGTPKDFITYAIPLSNIKMSHFIAVTSVARIPSIITSTIVGSALTTGDNDVAIIVTIVTLVIAILGIIFNKTLTNKIEKIVNDYKNKNV